jgi:alpha-N-arabinofuranosidase
MSFCRAIGAEPYFAGNVGSGTPAELSDWVEYCNFAGKSSLANERRANGEDDPFGIRFWGVGNENWGCGGHMTPQEYAALYSRYRTFMHAYSDTPVFAIACGPSDSHWSWTTGFFEQLDQHGKCRSCRVQGFAAHYYCGTAGTATEYTEKQWLELLARAKAVEGIIAGHRTLMDKHDPDRKIKLILDEWGAWHPVEPGKPDFGLYQQNTVRDAAVAALTLDIFNKNAEKLYMANIAQVANVLQSVLLIQGDHCIKTPTYHIFDLYQPHKGGTAVELTSSADIISYGEDSVEHCRSCYLTETNFLLRSVEGSATIKDGVLCITLVNTDPVNTRNIDMQVLGSEVGSAETKSLIARSIHDHNTFEDPEAVQLTITETIVPCDGRFEFSLPPASIIRLLTKATP